MSERTAQDFVIRLDDALLPTPHLALSVLGEHLEGEQLLCKPLLLVLSIICADADQAENACGCSEEGSMSAAGGGGGSREWAHLA